MKEFCTSLASLLGVLAFYQSLLQVVFLPELRFASLKFLNRALKCFSSYCYYDITEIDDVNTNELYNAVQLYRSSFVCTLISRLSLSHALNSSATTFGLSNNDCINDVFDSLAVQWEHVVTPRTASSENKTTITFWGLLNFPDGLWSCCGSERIFVFTTNPIEKLDPALLHSSRMDMHICMS